MSQPPTKKLKVTSASTVDQGLAKSPQHRNKRLQLATRHDPRPEDDVDGAPMAMEARAERSSTLKLYFERQKAIEDAEGDRALKDALYDAKEMLLASDAAARGRSPSHVRENYLRLKFSGLLQTCIDTALKFVEEGHPNNWVVVNYIRDVLMAEMLKGLEEVSDENLRHCKDFAKAYMPDYEFDEVDDSVYEKLKWFVKAKGDNKAYLKRFTIETLKDEIQEKLDHLEHFTFYLARVGAREVWTFLEENWREDTKDEEEYSSEESYPEGHPLRDGYES